MRKCRTPSWVAAPIHFNPPFSRQTDREGKAERKAGRQRGGADIERARESGSRLKHYSNSLSGVKGGQTDPTPQLTILRDVLHLKPCAK